MLLLLSSLATSCVTRGYPTHGGGKRFYREQEIITRAIDTAVGSLDFGKLVEKLTAPLKEGDGKRELSNGVTLRLTTVAHSGGGVQSGSNIGIAGLVSGLLTGGAMMASGQGAGSPALSPAPAPLVGPGSYSSYVFESADDAGYLAAVVTRYLADCKVPCHGISANEKENAGRPTLHVIVKELGIDQSDMNLIVYGEKRLKARVVVEAFLTQQGAHDFYEHLGVGQASYTFAEDFFLGFGPLSSQNVEGGVTNER